MSTKTKTSSRAACCYCGSTESLTVDHIIPISRWQEFHIKRRVLENSSNKVLACRPCNEAKSNMSPRDWFALHPEYKARFMRQAKYLPNHLKELLDID